MRLNSRKWITPGLQVHKQSRISHFIPIPFEHIPRHEIDKTPGSPGKLQARHSNASLGMPFRQVDDNQGMLAAAGPAPRHEVSEAFIVRPAG